VIASDALVFFLYSRRVDPAQRRGRWNTVIVLCGADLREFITPEPVDQCRIKGGGARGGAASGPADFGAGSWREWKIFNS